MERRLIFNVIITNGSIKKPDRKLIFGVNLPLKHFPATATNAVIRSPKSLHAFLKECLYHMLVKFEKKIVWSSMVQIARNFKHFWQSVGAILEDVSIAEAIV